MARNLPEVDIFNTSVQYFANNYFLKHLSFLRSVFCLQNYILIIKLWKKYHISVVDQMAATKKS